MGSYREVVPDQPESRYTNQIRTSKYRWYSFLPLNLLEQFHSLANIYFLVMCIGQTFPAISISKGVPTILPPLVLVMTLQAIKDVIEDRKRGQQDRKENSSTTRLVKAQGGSTAGSGQEIEWEAVRPGMVLKVSAEERLPADCLLLDSSDAAGICYVETSDLDGETFLKRKVAIPFSDVAGSEWRLHCEAPTGSLYEFKGALVRPGAPEQGVNANNLLLRGSNLRCTEWVHCLVVYCGHETRVMLNSHPACFKRSRLDRAINTTMVAVFIFQAAACLISGTCYAIWTLRADEAWYLMLDAGLEQREGPVVTARRSVVGGFLYHLLLAAGSWELQLSNMVPISLLVCLMCVKLSQSFLIYEDRELCDGDPEAGGRRTMVQTCQVIETLGQVTHVFSDKTGTLTCNVMEFRACSSAGRLYGTDASGALLPRQRQSVKVPYYDFHDADFLRDLGSQVSLPLPRLLLSLACCHSVTPTASTAMAPDKLMAGTSESELEKALEYEASSPDELALVTAARALGVQFLGQNRGRQLLRVRHPEGAVGKALRSSLTMSSPACPSLLDVELLDVCEFDNIRKRMSVVVRTHPGANPLLLVKGADSSLLPFISHKTSEDQRILKASQDHLHLFSCAGLRTLVFAERELGPEYYDWHNRHEQALASLAGDASTQLAKLAAEIEESSPCRLLGVSAVEDKLQDGVPEVIANLRCAGIVVWVLTGDKMETAINVGFSCQLLTSSMVNFEVDEHEAEAIRDHLERVLAHKAESQVALSITGTALARILETTSTSEPSLRRTFYEATQRCTSVVCCRVSPKQKADVVLLLQEFDKEAVSLCIGDGANDVTMITTADVGIGLAGKEGAQAARIADFSVGQFRFLGRLLFVHGRESYRRNAMLAAYNFYKNTVLCGAAILYGQYMSFSGQSPYDALLYQLFNVLYSAFPIIFYAVFDRPCKDINDLERHPEKWYPPGRRGEYYSITIRTRWMLLSCIHAFIVHRSVWDTYFDGQMCGSTTVGDCWSSFAALYAWVILAVNVTLIIQSSAHFWFTITVVVVSVCLYPVSLSIVEQLSFCAPLRGSSSFIYGFGCPRFWIASLSVLGMLVCSCMLILGHQQYANMELPDKEEEPSKCGNSVATTGTGGSGPSPVSIRSRESTKRPSTVELQELATQAPASMGAANAGDGHHW